MKLKNLMLLTFVIFLFANLPAYSQRLTLDDVLRIAVENNPEIKAAKLNIEKEEAVKLKAFNIPRPEIFLEYEGVKGSLKNFETRKIGVSQEFEFPTSYFLRSDVQSSQVDIAREELNRMTHIIKYQAGSAYLKLLLNYKLLEIANENLKIYNDFLFVAEKKYDAGSTANLEVLGAKVKKIKFEVEVRNIESQIITTRSELGKLMNGSYTNIEPVDEFAFAQRELSKEVLLKDALSNNPDIKIIALQKEKFSNKLSLTKSELLPNFSIKYYKQKIGDDSDFWGIEFGVGVPLWFWWEPTGNINEADYELQISTTEEINTKRTVENELDQAYEEYQNGLRQGRFFYDEAIPEVVEILRQAKISYEEGAIGYVEYLQALQTAYETKTLYLNSIYEYNKAILKLESIVAGDIK